MDVSKSENWYHSYHFAYFCLDCIYDVGRLSRLEIHVFLHAVDICLLPPFSSKIIFTYFLIMNTYPKQDTTTNSFELLPPCECEGVILINEDFMKF